MRRHHLAALSVPVLLLAACGEDALGGDDEGDTTTEPGTADVDDEGGTGSDPGDGTSAGVDEAITVELVDVEGEVRGTVSLSPLDDGTVAVEAAVEGLEPGFRGFHVHETGVCDPDADDGPFTSAGGHWHADGEDHGEHAGDLPSLLVNDDGSGTLLVHTAGFTVDELLDDEDGTALIVHTGPDNLGNVPDRYTSEDADEPGPDQETLATGDSGDRELCGVVEDGAGDAQQGATTEDD